MSQRPRPARPAPRLPPAETRAPRPWPRRAAVCGLVALFWVSLLALPDYAYDVRLDGSWELALGRLMSARAQAGVDYIFTYGPLGYFYTTAYQPDLFAVKYAWEAVVKLAMALAFAGVVVRLRSAVPRLLFCLGAVALLGPRSSSMRDTLYPLFVAIVTLALCRSRAGSVAAVGYGVLLAALALVKFSFFIFAALCLPVLIVVLAATGRRAAAALAPAAFVAALAAFWLAAGQAPANFGTFFRWSIEITSGFNEAMSMPGDERQLWLAIAILALIAAEFGAGAWALPRVEFWPLAIFVAGILFLQWKQGFTRHDDLHAEGFFGYTLLLPFALAVWFAPAPGQRLVCRLCLWVVVILSLAGLELTLHRRGGIVGLAAAQARQLPGRLEDALLPWRLAARLNEPPADDVTRFLLPATKSRVGDGTVDLLHYNLGVVFLNGFRWRPRPVFQSYSAYTPSLQEANARFFRSDRAPDYVLFHQRPIDLRFPATEDSQALLEILRRYHPVLEENGFLILERNRAESPVPTPGSARQWSVRFGETISVGDSREPQTMTVEIRPTTWGRFRSALYQPPVVMLNIGTSDGQEKVYRLVPAMSAEPFLLNPLIGDAPGILGLYGSPGAVRVRSFRILAPDGAAGDYQIPLRVTLTPRPGLVPEQLDAGGLRRLGPP